MEQLWPVIQEVTAGASVVAASVVLMVIDQRACVGEGIDRAQHAWVGVTEAWCDVRQLVLAQVETASEKVNMGSFPTQTLSDHDVPCRNQRTHH